MPSTTPTDLLLLDAPPTCAVCEDGWVTTGDGAVPCHCRQVRSIWKRLHDAQIPPRFRRCTVGGFEAQRPEYRAFRDAVARYVEAFAVGAELPNGLLLHGGVGSGKSHAAVAVLKALIERVPKLIGRYVNIVDFFEQLWRAIHTDKVDGGTRALDLLATLRDVDLLVIDDLGAEYCKEWGRERLYWLFDQRLMAARPVLVTTNYPLPGSADDLLHGGIDSLETRVGPRITSRLFELCRPLESPPWDWRRRL